jgi:HEAT repeat protein
LIGGALFSEKIRMTESDQAPSRSEWRLWLSTLFDADETNQGVAAEVLGKSGDPEAIQPLLAALENMRGMIAGGGPVAKALVQLRDVWSLPIFAKALSDSRAHVRRAAAEALGWMRDARAVETLIAALRDDFYGVRIEASWALGVLGDSRALQPLLAVLHDADEDVRRNAAEALGQLGDPRAREALLAALDDRDPGVRAAAEDALSRLATEIA